MNGFVIRSAALVGTVPDRNWQIRASGDFNGDAKADIPWHHQVTGDVVLFFMNGSTISSISSVGAVPDPNWQIRGSGDYNADGKADFLWHNRATGDVFMFLMDGLDDPVRGVGRKDF